MFRRAQAVKNNAFKRIGKKTLKEENNKYLLYLHVVE